MSRAGPDKRAGDHAGKGVIAGQDLAGDPAVSVQFIDRNDLFVSGDLEDAVCGGVNDQISGPHMFFTEFIEDRCAGGNTVAEDAAAGLFPEGFQNDFAESVRIGRERFGADNAGDLPVADRGVFPRGKLMQAGKSAGRVFRRSVADHPFNVSQTQRFHDREAEARGLRRDVSQCVGVMVSKGLCIRGWSHPDAVQYDQKNTFNVHIQILDSFFLNYNAILNSEKSRKTDIIN